MREPAQNKTVCKKCVKKDMIDGYGRCTNCVEPSATKAEMDKAAEEFTRGYRHD